MNAPPVCHPEDVDLKDFESWRRQEGYWIGEYTLLGADGNPNVDENWPYSYDHYKGFIHLELFGSHMSQRQVFVYPPQAVD